MSTKGLFIERAHCEVGIAAVADAWGADGVGSDIVNMRNHNKVVFIIHWGVGATGINKFTVEACDDVSASNTTAIPFHYRQLTAGSDPGAVTAVAVAATGFSNTAASNQVIMIEVSAEDVRATGYQYVRCYADETTDSPLLGGILILLLDPIFANNEQSELT